MDANLIEYSLSTLETPKKLFMYDKHLILINENCAGIIDSESGNLVKNFEFGKQGCDISTVNIINRSKKSNLYWKYNMNPF